jgi:hypothetical protein
MRRDTEIAVRRALSSRHRRLTATEIAELCGADLADVLTIEMENAKDLASWRMIGEERKAA